MAFGGKPSAQAKGKQQDEGEGYEMGSVRGAGRDGAGSYEAVGVGQSSKEPV